MSFQLQNFSKSYQQAVSSVKQIKQCNQRIQQKSSTDFKSQQIMVENAKRKKQYLDPQTSRRVQIVKQQLNTEYKKYEELIKELNNKGKGKNVGKEEILASQDQEAHNNLLAFDHETQARLQHQKNNQLSQAHKKLVTIQNLTQQTKKLTYEQGQTIDIIDENISTTHTNVKQSNKYLEIANSQQKKGQKKYVCLIALAFAVLAVVLLFIFLL